jgi:hypothetical protein
MQPHEICLSREVFTTLEIGGEMRSNDRQAFHAGQAVKQIKLP